MEAAQMGSVRMRSLTPLLFMRYRSSFGGAGKRPPKEQMSKKSLYDSGKHKKKTQSSSPKLEESQNWLSRMKNVTDAIRQQSRAKSVGKTRQKYYSASATDTYKDWSRLSESHNVQKVKDELVHTVVKNKRNELKTANEIAFASAKKYSKSSEANVKSESDNAGLKTEKGIKGSPTPETRLSKEMEEWVKKNMSMLEKMSGVPSTTLKINESILTKKPAESGIGNPFKFSAPLTGTTDPRASLNVFKKSISGSNFNRDVGEIKAELSRLRHDKNVEKDSLKFSNEKPTREPKGINKLLQIRPRYVENIVDMQKPHRKKSSSSGTELSTSKSKAPAKRSKSFIYDLTVDPKTAVKNAPSRVKTICALDEKRNGFPEKNEARVKLNKNVQGDNKGFVIVGETSAAKTFGKNTTNFVLHDNPNVKKDERKKASSCKSETWASSQSTPVKRSQSFGYDLKIDPHSGDKNVVGKYKVKRGVEEVFNSFDRSVDGRRKALKDVHEKSKTFDTVNRSNMARKGGEETISYVPGRANSKMPPKEEDAPNSALINGNNFKSTNISCIPAANRTSNTNKPGVDQNELDASELKDRLNDRIMSHYRLTSIKNDESVSLQGEIPLQINAGKWGQNDSAPFASRDGRKSNKAQTLMDEAVLEDSRAVKSPKPIIDMMTGIQSRTMYKFRKDAGGARRAGAIKTQQLVTAKPPKVPELKADVRKSKKKAKKTKQMKWQANPSRSEPRLSITPEEGAASSVLRARSALDYGDQLYRTGRSSAGKSGNASKPGTFRNSTRVSGETSPDLNTVDIGDEELWSKMVRNRMSNYETLTTSPLPVKSGSSVHIRGSKSPKRTNNSQNFPKPSAPVSGQQSAITFHKANSPRRDNTNSSSETKTENSPQPVTNKSNPELIQSIRDQWGEDLRVRYPNLDKFVSRLRSKNSEYQNIPTSEKIYSYGVEEGDSQEKGQKPSGELFRSYDQLADTPGLNQSYRLENSVETPRRVNMDVNTSSNARGDLTPPSMCASRSNVPQVISSKSSVNFSYDESQRDATQTRGVAVKPRIKSNYKIVPLEEWMKTREGLLTEKMEKTPHANSARDRQDKLSIPAKSQVFYTNEDRLSLSDRSVHSDRYVKRFSKMLTDKGDHREQMLKTGDRGNFKSLGAVHEMYKDICETYLKAGGRADKSSKGVACRVKEVDVFRTGSSVDPRPKDVLSVDRTPQSAARSQSILDVDSVLSQMQLSETYRAMREGQGRTANMQARGETPVYMSTSKLCRGLDGMMSMTVNSVEDCKWQPEGEGRQMMSPRSTCSKVPSRRPDSGDLSHRTGITERSKKPSDGCDEFNYFDDNLREILAVKRRQQALEAQKELIYRCEDNIRKHESALERYRALLSMAQEEGIDIINGDNTKRR